MSDSQNHHGGATRSTLRLALGVLLVTLLPLACKRASAPPAIPLVDAILTRDSAAVQAHLAAGSDVNAATANGVTPLVAAASSGQPETIKSLLAAGADINAPGSQGNTPLIAAIQAEQTQAALLLIEQPGVNLEAREEHGSTALVEAVAMRLRDVVESLAEHGADVNAPGPVGRTALHVAAMQHDPELIAWLLAHGADAQAVDDSGAGVLAYVPIFPMPRSAEGADDVVASFNALLEADCDVNAADQAGHTPLHNAMLYADPWVIEWLLGAGADPLRQAGNGLSPVAYLAVSEQGPPRSHEQLQTIIQMFRDAGVTDESIIDARGTSLARLIEWVEKRK